MLVIALKCWHCDSVQNAYCGEPFAGKNLTNPTTYVQCPPKDANSKSVCVKAKVKRKEKNHFKWTQSRSNVQLHAICLEFFLATGVIIRQCAGSDEDAQRVCNFGLNSAEYCEYCDEDGCNIGARFDPLAIQIITIFPVLIATVLPLI